MGLYDNLTFNQGTYVPQYAGAPLEEIKQTADTLSGRHYQNLAQANQLQILANQMKSKLLPGAKSGVDKHIEQLDLALQDMAKSGGENSTARVFAMANALQSDQGILNATQRAAEYNKQTELIDQLTAKGEIPLFDKARREQLANAPIGSEMLLTPFEALVEPYRDPNPEMEDIWKVVNPDSYEGELRTAMNSKTGKPLVEALGREDLGLFYETITSGGIGETKIKNQLENAWANYKNSASYKQQTGKLVGKSEAEVKKEFLAKGLTRIFNNLKRDYRNLPKEAAGSGSGNPMSMNIPTYAPAKVIESAISYDEDGKTPISERKSTEDVLEYTTRVEGEKAKAEKEFDPQYLKDLKTAESVLNLKGLKPGSTAAKNAVAQYNDMRKQRVNNASILTVDKNTATAIGDKLQREWRLRQYMAPDGTVINAVGADGNVTEEFMELTGGDPSKFEIESIYDAKNHFSTNENFVQPISIISKDKDGNPKQFLASQLPGLYSTPVKAVNTNALYKQTNLNPGQEIEFGSGIKATALTGYQFAEAGIPDLQGQYIIKAIVPGLNNDQPLLFDSPEHLAEVLEKRGIKLNVK